MRFFKPGLQGVTSVIAKKGEPTGSVLLVNGRGMTRKATVTKMMAHLPMLLHPHPDDPLVLRAVASFHDRIGEKADAEALLRRLIAPGTKATPAQVAWSRRADSSTTWSCPSGWSADRS